MSTKTLNASVTLVTLLTSAVAVEQSFAKARGDFDRALLAVAVKATDDLGFAWPVKDAPNYSGDKVSAVKEAVTKAFASYAPDYQRKIWQRITDHAADYILSENAPKKVAAIAAGLDGEVYDEVAKKADRTIAGQARLKAAKEAKEAAEKKMPPLSKEAKAAKAAEAAQEATMAFIDKAIEAIRKMPVANSTVAAQVALLNAKELVMPPKE